MDIKDMEYFTAIATEGTISGAAEYLHITQPGLSRKMKDLEEELGVRLFVRGSRRIHLTEEGVILKKRSEEIMSLMRRTHQEISGAHKNITGHVHIGAGESKAFCYLTKIIKEMQKEYPGVTFSITSGDSVDLMEGLESGLLDIALIFNSFDQKQYQGILAPKPDELGILMKKDSPLAKKEAISFQDIAKLPIIMPRGSQHLINGAYDISNMNIVAKYNLMYNASVMVKSDIGYAIGFDGLINTDKESPFTFRPFKTPIYQQGHIIWKKYQTQTPVVAEFIKRCEKLG